MLQGKHWHLLFSTQIIMCFGHQELQVTFIGVVQMLYALFNCVRAEQ